MTNIRIPRKKLRRMTIMPQRREPYETFVLQAASPAADEYGFTKLVPITLDGEAAEFWHYPPEKTRRGRAVRPTDPCNVPATKIGHQTGAVPRTHSLYDGAMILHETKLYPAIAIDSTEKTEDLQAEADAAIGPVGLVVADDLPWKWKYSKGPRWYVLTTPSNDDKERDAQLVWAKLRFAA